MGKLNADQLGELLLELNAYQNNKISRLTLFLSNNLHLNIQKYHIEQNSNSTTMDIENQSQPQNE